MYIYIWHKYLHLQYLSIPLLKAVFIAAGGVRLSRVVITRDSRPVFIFVNAIVLFNLVHTN